MRKVKKSILMGALALTVLIPSAAFAATSGTSTNTSTPSTNQSKYGAHNWQHKPGNRSFMNADEIKTLADKYTPELSAQFQQVFDSMKTNAPHKSFPALDAATKQKLDAIHQQLKDGKITKEQAQQQMAQLGIKMPLREGHGHGPGMGANLDAATKQKLDDIRQQVKDGKITKEQAQQEIAKLGIKFPQRAGHAGKGQKMNKPDGVHEQLGQAVKANDTVKIKALLPQLLTELQAHMKNQTNSTK